MACGVPSTATSPAEQLHRDAEAIHALGVSGVQARTITADGRELVSTSGSAELHSGAPVDPEGYFRMASTAKTLVATVVLQLDAEGTLSLDDSLAHWLPEVVRGSGIDADHITVRQLLQHTSGIHDDLPGYTTAAEYYGQRHDIYTSAQLVSRALSHAPDFAPGAGWSYSNTGYLLLSMLIERITGRASHREIQDRILTPLAMNRTRWLGTSPTLPDPHATAYQFFGPGAELDVTDQIAVDPETLSWVSTTRDENIFLRALLSGRLLPPHQLAAMKQTVPVSTDLQPMWPGGRYGLGLAERPLSCGGIYFGHEGGDGGYITLNGVAPDGTRSTVVSMSEALGDTPEHILAQESAASTFIDHALCSRDLNPTT
ncbi:serine hydrolase domain-containing protein [Nocardia sp. NPDC059240]|uniref:serine hydrolase domain-containing protein n=1 Tax=Nocardia sp. NPDC059240 TaxID=3346786 RepID=UPI00368D011F